MRPPSQPATHTSTDTNRKLELINILDGTGAIPRKSFWDAAFYPFLADGEDPVLAVCGSSEVIILRLSRNGKLEVINCFVIGGYDLYSISAKQRQQSAEELCSLCWAKSPGFTIPLLAIAGSSHIITVIEAKSGNVYTTLAGHGGEIQQLAANPANPSIIASASVDHTVRIWTVDPKHKKQPCMVLCGGGEAHRETVLTVAWHASGKYLLTGGMDHVINLWKLPEEAVMKKAAGTDGPVVLYSPHFSSCDIHGNYVDSIWFLGDLVISKSAQEDKIVLWHILGFNSKVRGSIRDHHDSAAPPTNHGRKETTRSAFGSGFERLLQLSCPRTGPFFMRFGLHHSSARKEVYLAMGSTNGEVYFWDLKAMMERGGIQRNVDVWHTTSSSSSLRKSTGTGGAGASVRYASAYEMDEKTVASDFTTPFTKLKAHQMVEVPIKADSMCIRQCAWSIDGRYLAAIGERGFLVLYKR